MSDVTDQLTKRGVPHEVISHEQAYTSTDEALALGISADELVKTIVLDTGSGHALAVIPGSRRLDIRAAERAVGDKHVRLATEEEIEKDFPGYELGAMPPDRSTGRQRSSTRRSCAMTRWCSPRERRPSRSRFGRKICSATSR